MLVCNVSLRPPGRAIAVDLVEAAAAVDASTTGFVIFATLVDDPASVSDNADAYLGEIMLEAASATADATVGLEYAAGVDEPVAAADSVNGTTGLISTRSAMVAGPRLPVFINPGASRQANANGVMINL